MRREGDIDTFIALLDSVPHVFSLCLQSVYPTFDMESVHSKGIVIYVRPLGNNTAFQSERVSTSISASGQREVK